MLIINDVTFRMGARVLLDKASASINTGSRVGFVARNGTGKTTLFKIIRGELGTETGSVMVGKGLRIGSVAQEAPGGPESLLDVVLAATLILASCGASFLARCEVRAQGIRRCVLLLATTRRTQKRTLPRQALQASWRSTR